MQNGAHFVDPTLSLSQLTEKIRRLAHDPLCSATRYLIKVYFRQYLLVVNKFSMPQNFYVDWRNSMAKLQALIEFDITMRPHLYSSGASNIIKHDFEDEYLAIVKILGDALIIELGLRTANSKNQDAGNHRECTDGSDIVTEIVDETYADAVSKLENVVSEAVDNIDLANRHVVAVASGEVPATNTVVFDAPNLNPRSVAARALGIPSLSHPQGIMC